MFKTLEDGDRLFEEGKYRASFNVFKQIGSNEKLSPMIRADAYHMLGVLVSFSPDLSEYDDESGVKYYELALSFNKNKIPTLLNIISAFGESPNMHHNISLFKDAYNKLMKRKSELDHDSILVLRKKHNLMQKMKKKK